MSSDELRDQLQRTLSSAYTIERELGGGGMSRVFVADDSRLGRKVVVKVLSPELAAGVSAARFEREIRLAAALQQANIVPLLNAGDTDGLPFYTMPFVDGRTLRARLQAGRMPIPEVVAVLRDVARALAYAHEHGVVHRDIKPENILLSGDTAVVADFGIAKALSAARTRDTGDTLTQAGMTVGTPAYMAPEQWASDPTSDHRADLYSLGCVGYEMLSGKPPFEGHSMQRLLRAHASEAPVPIMNRREHIPSALASLIERCLDKDPDRRPQSAREVLQALEQVTAPAAGEGTRRSIWIAGTAAILVAALALAWWNQRSRRQSEPMNGSTTRSVAVLPFVNASGDTSSNYFVAGMSDEVAAVLSKLPTLRVASRRSIDIIRERPLSPQEIGKALAVGLLLEGTVRRSGDRVRVTANLIDVSDASIRWTKSYDRTTRDAFVLQDDIAEAIARELRVAFDETAVAAGRAGRTTNQSAYDFYMRGRYATELGTEAGLRQAIAYYQRAVEIDPTFARAEAGIASAWTYLADAYVPAADAYPRAMDAARRALAMDSLVAEAHAAEGYSKAVLTLDPAALQSLERAVALDPNSVEARLSYSQLLCSWLTNRCEEGIVQAQKAVELDPLSPIAYWTLGGILFFARRYDETIAAARRIKELDPRFVMMDDLEGASLREKGDFDGALRVYDSAQRNWPQPMFGRAMTYGRMGRKDEALRIARELERLRSSGQQVVPEFLALIYASVGDRDRALQWLSVARREHSAWFLTVGDIPQFDSLRNDPRYVRLLRP